MSMTISVRVEHKDESKTSGQLAHDMRVRVPVYVDKSLSSLNSVILKPEFASILKKIAIDRRSKVQHKRAMKSNAAVSTAGILTFSSEASKFLETFSRVEQDRLIFDSVSRVAVFMKNEISGIVVHRDESALHAHFQMCAVNNEGVPNSKFLTPALTSEMQDIAAKSFEKIGITRGVHKKTRVTNSENYSAVVHRSVKQLHEDLPFEIDFLKKTISVLTDKVSKNQRLIAEQIEKLKEQKVTEEKSQKRIEAYERRALDASDEIATLEDKVRQLEDLISKKDILLPPAECVEVVTEAGSFFKNQSTEMKQIVTVENANHYLKKVEFEYAKTIKSLESELTTSKITSEQRRSAVTVLANTLVDLLKNQNIVVNHVDLIKFVFKQNSNSTIKKEHILQLVEINKVKNDRAYEAMQLKPSL